MKKTSAEAVGCILAANWAPKRKFRMKAGIAHGIVPSVNLEIYRDVGVGDASLEYMQAVKAEVKG
jgi:hypothetical protein